MNYKHPLLNNLIIKPLLFIITFMLTIGNPQMVPSISANPTPPTIDPLPEVTGELAGYLAGSFGVNEGGSATYSMDLAVPPGTGGVVPKLSLSYDSRGRSSVLGVGWSLTGLSAITRCSTTKAQDGFIDGVDFDDNDKFCLDGQRLVAINGTYGADGTEYRTENEIFAQVFSYGVAASGPERFVVKTKSGLIYSYGNTADSRVEAQGKTDVLIWQADKVEDTVGNYYTITYHEDNTIGESYPTRIDYTGNADEGLTPYNSVVFEYETRPDITPRYVSGSMVKLTQRLKTIKMNTDANLAWEYTFSYEQGSLGGRSRLISVEECDDANICLDPTTFSWQEGERDFDVPSAWFHEPAKSKANQPEWSNPSYGVYVLLQDMNGDGLPDRVGHYDYPTSQYGLWIALNNGNGYDAPTRWFHEPLKDKANQPVWSTPSAGTYILLQDMNGDGLPDRVGHYNYETSEYGLWVSLNTGSGFEDATRWFHEPLKTKANQPIWSDQSNGTYSTLQDINGDNLPDRLEHYDYGTSQYGLWVSLNNGNGFDAKTRWFHEPLKTKANQPVWSKSDDGTFVHLQDINADGLPDRLAHYDYPSGQYGLWVALNTGTGFETPTRWFHETAWHKANQPVWSNPDYGVRVLFQDMNGDGLPDRVAYYDYDSGEYGLWVALNKGDGFEAPIRWFHEPLKSKANQPVWSHPNNGTYVHLQDINGDGLPDRLGHYDYGTSQYGLWVALNNGSGFDTPEKWFYESGWHKANQPVWRNPDDGIRSILRDMDGDGLIDRVSYYDYDATQYRLWVSLSKEKAGLLTSITNGNGATTTIEYAPLTDKSIYTKDSDAIYPVQDVAGPMYVVAAYETDDGLGGTARMDYHYEGLKVSTNGRGFCGFRKVTATNQETGIKTSTFYRQEHPYKSMAFKKEVRLSDDTLINRIEDTWSVTNFAHGGYFPHVTQSVVEDYEIDGTHVNTTTTSKTFDNFGNATQVVTSQSDEHSTTTNNTYTDDVSNWFLGRLTRGEVTKQAPGQSVLTRVSSFAYDATTGLLNEEVTEPDDVDLWLKKTYVHDGYGNILSSTTSGADITARTQTTTYDARGQFEITSTNALGHSETKAYDVRHGKVISLTGPNNLTTTWAYDSFGRVTNEYRADGTESRTLYYKADAQSPAGTTYYVRKDSSGSVPSIAYYDVLDRQFRTETIGFNGQKIFVDQQYNDRGEVTQVSDPYFEGDTPVWTVNQYDDLGRITQVTAPANRVSTTSYNGFTTSVTNPLGQTNTRTVNSLEQMVESKDNLNNAITYTYDSNGNLIEMLDPLGNTTTMQYDIVGNKIQMDDPDSGITTYTYNALGQLVSQTDANNNTVTNTYDDLGRLTERTELEGVTTWEYDTQAFGIGKLTSMTSPNNYSETNVYDSLGRLSSLTTRPGTSTDYIISRTYDVYGRLDTLTYPTGFAIQYAYTNDGYLHQVLDESTSQLYWQADTMNARGQLESQTAGNGLTTNTSYDTATGFMSNRQTETIQNLNFTFDAIGNLTQRQDVLINATEDFTYDTLNRLTKAEVVGGDLTDVAYDILGNITSMSNVGTYTYGENGAGVHAVTSIVGAKPNTYSYDANGNRTQSNDGSVYYTSFNKPKSINNGNYNVSFRYNGAYKRYHQSVKESGVLKKVKRYIGGIYELHDNKETGVKDRVHFIRAGSDTVAIYTKKSDGSPDTVKYLHKDHLGSIQTITDAAAQVIEVLSFDAWGNRRDASDWSTATAPITSETDRGFTGHEQLDQVDLIHMNGRVYDPVIGRFLSADPNIQAPENLQNLNRYSYVLNNPLSYTDPSGFFFSKIFKAIKNFIQKHKVVIIAAAIGIATGIWVSGVLTGASSFSVATLANLTIGQAIVAGAASGFTAGVAGTLAAGGGLSQALKAGVKGGVFGGISGGIFRGIGMHIPPGTAKVVAHGVAGGFLNLAQGGKFHHGFISSSVVKLLGPGIEQIGDQNGISSYRVAAAALLGGAVSEVTGGRFANGAITSSFAQLFNGELSRSDNFKGKFLGFKGLKLPPPERKLLGEGLLSYPSDVTDIASRAFEMEGVAINPHETAAYDFGRRTGYAAVPMRVIGEAGQFFYYSTKDVYSRLIYKQAGEYQPYTLRGPGGIFDSGNDIYHVYLGARDSNTNVENYPASEFNPIK